MNFYIPSVILMLFVVVIFTRFLPFIFTKQIAKNIKIQVLGTKLPAYIMMLLLIYQLRPASFVDLKSCAIPFLSLFMVFIIHKSLRKPLVSIACGITCYYLLSWFWTSTGL
jgi:branched-subunit amino acid transport protein AzlD